MYRGDIFVLSAPSGAGKSTLISKVLPKFTDITFSVSYTSRPPREGEIHGKHYFFVNEQEFRELIARDEFIEWAYVHGNYYGTSKRWLNEQLSQGKDVLLDIDVQGAKNIKKCFPDAVLIFILPPSFEELERRLTKRGTETRQKILERLENARHEIKHIKLYDYTIINDDLERASYELEAIFTSTRCKTLRVLASHPQFNL